jgi:hypothetical protein
MSMTKQPIAPKMLNIPPATSVRIRAQFRAIKTPIAVAIAIEPNTPYIPPTTAKSAFGGTALFGGSGVFPIVIHTIRSAIIKKKSPKQISQIPTSTIPTVRFMRPRSRTRILALLPRRSK